MMRAFALACALQLIALLPIVGSAACAAGEVRGVVVYVDDDGQPTPGALTFVVFLEAGDARTRSLLDEMKPPVKAASISHKGMNFTPRMLAVNSGTSVDFVNDDGIYHNAFSLSRAMPFDLGIYPRGTTRSVQFTKPGLVRVYCNIHPKMVSSILVLDTPFSMQTNGQGEYSFQGVPAGDYRVRAWSQDANEAEVPVTHREGITEVPTLYSQKSAPHPMHPNKFGKPYRSKY